MRNPHHVRRQQSADRDAGRDRDLRSAEGRAAEDIAAFDAALGASRRWPSGAGPRAARAPGAGAAGGLGFAFQLAGGPFSSGAEVVAELDRARRGAGGRRLGDHRRRAQRPADAARQGAVRGRAARGSAAASRSRWSPAPSIRGAGRSRPSISRAVSGCPHGPATLADCIANAAQIAGRTGRAGRPRLPGRAQRAAPHCEIIAPGRMPPLEGSPSNEDERQPLLALRAPFSRRRRAALPRRPQRPGRPLRRPRRGVGAHRARAGRRRMPARRPRRRAGRQALARAARSTSPACAPGSSTCRSIPATSARARLFLRRRATARDRLRAGPPRRRRRAGARGDGAHARRDGGELSIARGAARATFATVASRPTISRRSSTRRARPAARRARC